MNRILLLATILFLVGSFPRAQTLSRGSQPQDVVTARVDKLFEKWNRTDSPGCALSVMKDGHIVYEHGYGMADLDHDVVITPATVFHVASMSKQFTAASIVLLAQQGKLSLDDDVHKYVPELPDFGTPITIRNLIYHTSGLRDQWELLVLAGWRYSLDLITDDDVMWILTRQRELNFKPGDQYMYSNTGYTLLALIVQRVSGVSFREFTTKNIFEPLGMKNTHFRDDHAEIVKNNAYGYEAEKGGFRISNTNFDTVGATSLHTTVEDLAFWDENFYHPRVGEADFLSHMLERGTLNNGEKLNYAFGLFLGKYKGLPTVDHAGGDAGYRSDLTRFPDQHFSVAVLCNAGDSDPTSITRKIADIYLAQQISSADTTEAPPPIQPTLQQASRIVGLYWDRENDQFVKSYLKDGELRAALSEDQDFKLSLVSEMHFQLADVSFGEEVNLTFEPVIHGKTKLLLETSGDQKPAVYEAVEPFTPTSAELSECTGDYVSEELNSVYRIIMQEGKLTLTRMKYKPAPLEPRVRDAFSSSLGTIRFTYDANQHISGFLLNAARIRNLRFSRRGE